MLFSLNLTFFSAKVKYKLNKIEFASKFLTFWIFIEALLNDLNNFNLFELKCYYLHAILQHIKGSRLVALKQLIRSSKEYRWFLWWFYLKVVDFYFLALQAPLFFISFCPKWGRSQYFSHFLTSFFELGKVQLAILKFEFLLLMILLR